MWGKSNTFCVLTVPAIRRSFLSRWRKRLLKMNAWSHAAIAPPVLPKDCVTNPNSVTWSYATLRCVANTILSTKCLAYLKFSPPSAMMCWSPPFKPKTNLFKWLTSSTFHNSSSVYLSNGSKFRRRVPENNTGSCKNKTFTDLINRRAFLRNSVILSLKNLRWDSRWDSTQEFLCWNQHKSELSQVELYNYNPFYLIWNVILYKAYTCKYNIIRTI